METRYSIAMFALFAVPFTARAADCLPVVHDGWVRLPPAQMPMTAAFGRLQNDCATPASVVSASSPAFGSVELHETREVDGISRMRHVPELAIAAGQSAELRPGGLHLMLMQPKAALKAGEKVVVELGLADGRRIQGEFEVRPATPR